MSERIPHRFRTDVVREIGHGGEATVYELAGGRVLRVFHRRPHDPVRLAAFYRRIARGGGSFATPEIIEQGDDGGVAWSLDRLIPGRPLHDLLALLAGEDRERALASYADAACEIAALPYTGDEYGEFLRDEDSIRAPDWSAYLLARMQRSLRESAWLASNVDQLDRLVSAVSERIETLSPAPKSLVHGDYFPGNVLVSEEPAVSGVIDFGPLTVIGDPWLDLASALIFLEVAEPGYTPADTAFVRDRLLRRTGSAFLDRVTTYRAWYAIRFSPYRNDDANLYAWCVRSLRQSAVALLGA